MTSSPTNGTQYDATSEITLVGDVLTESKRPSDDVSSWLWAPYVTISSVLALLIVASFVRFHCRNGHRYRTNGQLVTKTTLAPAMNVDGQLSWPSSSLARQWRPRYAWMDKNGAITSSSAAMMSLASFYEPSFFSSASYAPGCRRPRCPQRSQRPSSVGPTAMIALHPTTYCRRTSTLDVVIEVRSEESIPDVVEIVGESTVNELRDSPMEKIPDVDSRLGRHSGALPAEATVNGFRATDWELHRPESSSDSTESGSSELSDEIMMAHAWPDVAADLAGETQQCHTDSAITLSLTSSVSPTGGTDTVGGWVATFNESYITPDDGPSAIVGPTEGVRSHVTDVLRTAPVSSSHQLIMVGQLFVVVPSGADTEQLIADED